jgi:arylsulfatase A-like enzyme
MRTVCQESLNMATAARVLGRLFPVVALCCISASGHGAETGRGSSSPNIVFILVDDLGWSDLGCYGNKFIETPFTDSLAADGMRFTSAYTAPVCTPSRGMILSGQSSARTGLYKVPFQGNDRPWAQVIPPENWGYRPIDSKPLGTILSGGGYASKLLGKVHVPQAFTEGLDGMTNPQEAKIALGETFHQKLLDFSRGNPGKQVGPITRQAIEFIASNKDGPFFCYVGHHIPHIPLVARDELTKKYEAKWKRQPADVHPHYAAMCEAMDDSVGLILEALDRLGLSDNTMVVFFSDNGGVNRCFYDGKGDQITNLGPLRGEKGGIYEGGIRVPLIVRWPGQVEPGSVCDTPVISTDFLPTFVEAAGITLPKKQIVDGISLVPLLRGRAGVDRERLFLYFPDYHHDFPGAAVRHGDYKLIESSEDGHLELYNLADDVGEKLNLAATMRDKAAELKKALHAWRKALGAKPATPNPEYDPWRQHLLDPDAEEIRQRYLPIAWPPTGSADRNGARDSAKPLMRDCDTGYLLNCSFRAIRAYPWKKKTPLTGWVTDDRGGVWEASPVGFLPDQLGFHVDWFRLRDTSTDHGLTIKHQIARQTQGVVTWEFRFMMPQILDGATWQLRDLHAAAVSMIVHDGKLCCESTDRPPLALKQIQAGCEYGVRVAVNLAERNASFAVDGQLVADGVPFLNQAESLDYVSINTGKETLGELYLPVVNVHKGYTVNESFLTAGTGSLPHDWNRVSETGKVSVEQFKCSARPDVFSLRLADGGKSKREFAAINGKTVCECRFLMPEKQDGATIELHGRDKRAGVIQTCDGHLCYVAPTGRRTVLVGDYREDLWYAIKMIADPQSASAECYVNGKLAASDLPLGRVGIGFEQVQFAAPPKGTLWLDDVRVYPGREYPADYVPEPEPVNQADGYLVGTQSCSLWKEGDAYAGWDYVYPYAENRKPYLGWYDEGKPEVADWEIKWQVEHGIDFEQYCWYRPNDAVNHPIKNGVLEHGIREGLFNARYSKLKKFTIMYTNSGAGRTNPDDWQRHIIPYWIEYFFKDPRYLKVDGKPVLAIYHLPNLLSDFGGEEGTARALTVLREACRDARFPGIVILCEERNAKPVSMQQMKAIGIDYCYAYTWYTGDTQRQKQMMKAQREAAAGAGLGVVPSVSVGWEPSPWGNAGDGWVPVDDYKALAQWTRDTYMPALPADSIGSKMVLLPNWNEFGEGHFIMPSTLAGFGYVDAIREVFSGRGPHHDEVPTEAQKRRFTVLYPRD